MYYKVVKRVENDLFSCCIKWGYRYIGKQYVPGQWTVVDYDIMKQGLGLMVFDSFDSAKIFYRTIHLRMLYNGGAFSGKKFEVWECDIVPFPEDIETKKYKLNCDICSNQDVIQLLPMLYEKMKEDETKYNKVNKFIDGSIMNAYLWPQGTVFASQVKLIEKVYPISFLGRIKKIFKKS